MGGVAGHLSHLHENLDFTFGEIRSILRDVASANIEVVEKVDGQNLFFTYRDGALMTARNAGDVKKGGMTPEEFAGKWKGHPAEDAFMNGFKAITRAVERMSDQDKADVFANGGNYINAEIMYVGNPNIIQYGANNVVLHNLQNFDGPEPRVESQGPFKQLVQAVEDIEGELDAEGWRVSGPQIVELQDISQGEHLAVLEDGLSSFGMSDDATIGDFVAEKLRQGEVGNIPIPVVKQEELINIIIGKESAPSYSDFKKSIPKDVHKTVSALATKTNSKKTIARTTAPIERVISDFAIEVMRGMKSFFQAGDSDAEISRMKEELQASISAIESAQGSDAEALGDMLAAQMEKLGDIENVASDMEGIVFEHPPGSGKLYKLTGSFAMANQIIGRARRMGPSKKDEALIREYLRYALPFVTG
tara:strand:+ start:361 stop:1617 length:1257 start_codon:yes stop_codon:yes gene_type:complete